MSPEKTKITPLEIILATLFMGSLFWLLFSHEVKISWGQELTPLQQDLQTIENLDPNYIPINKLFDKIKLKDKDTAEAYSIIYGKLENIQRKCGKN